MQLFPVTTFKPVPCNAANGSVALSRWLMPGAAAKVDPAIVEFSDVVHAVVNDGELTDLKGNAESVQRINNHYDLVSKTLGIRRNRIHSWHAGMNPRTFFHGNANTELDEWSAISFASPRYLHFHTCGDIPPGEIAWSIFNPSVWIDDELYWQNGELVWLQRQDNQLLIEKTVDAECLLENSLDIGL